MIAFSLFRAWHVQVHAERGDDVMTVLPCADSVL